MKRLGPCCAKHKDSKIFLNNLNSVRLVLICQGFSHISGFLHHFVLPNFIATSSIRVNMSTSTHFKVFKAMD